jgi:hypothetical protein
MMDSVAEREKSEQGSCLVPKVLLKEKNVAKGIGRLEHLGF